MYSEGLTLFSKCGYESPRYDFTVTRCSALLHLLVFWLQVDPDVFAALPKDLQEELRSAYNRGSNVQPQAKISKSPVRSVLKE